MKLATECYVKKDNKTLMLHRIKKENDIHEGRWVGLGGKVEPGETPEECVIREVLEESGLKIKNPILRGVLTFPKFNSGDDWYVFIFTANDFEGNLEQSKEGTLKWIDDSEIFNLNLWDGDKIFMKWIEDEKIFSGKFVYEGENLAEHSVTFYR